MRDKKWRYETFSFYDFTGISAHFTKMAEKGWLIEKISNFGWIYRRIEPKKLTFSVCYYPRASEFDPEPSEEQRMFLDFCEHTGWVLAATWAQMQIFYSERENPTSIETDPVLEVETVHAAVKRNYIPSYILLTVLGVMNFVLFAVRLKNDFIGVLASATNLFTGLCWIVLLFLCVMELAAYYTWHAKAKQAAVLGVLPDSPSRDKIQKLVLCFVLLGFVYWQVSVFSTGTKVLRTVSVLMLLYMAALFAAANGVKALLKRKKASRGVNRTVTVITTVVLSFVMMGAITYGTLRMAQRGALEFDGRIYQTEPPLTVEDLMDVSNEEYFNLQKADASLLLGQFSLQQHAPTNYENRVGDYSLDYCITEVKLPVLYRLCKQNLLDEHSDSIEGEWVIYDHYEPADPAPWGAEEAYRLYRGGERAYLDQYILCFENRIVEIIFYWEPTAEQITIAGEKLAG